MSANKGPFSTILSEKAALLVIVAGAVVETVVAVGTLDDELELGVNEEVTETVVEIEVLDMVVPGVDDVSVLKVVGFEMKLGIENGLSDVKLGTEMGPGPRLRDQPIIEMNEK